MGNRVSKKLAQQIVNTVKDVCGHDINVIDAQGMIFASTNEERIGQYHEIGKRVAKTGEMIEVGENESYQGTQKGVNMPVFHNGLFVAVIGISGDPDVVKKYAYLAVRIMMLLIREQEIEAHTHSQKERMQYVLGALINQEGVNSEYLFQCLEEMKISLEGDKRIFYIQIHTRYNSSNLSLMERKLVHLFKEIGCEIYMYQYPNQYVGMIPEEALEHTCRILGKFADETKEVLKVSIGSPNTIYQLKKSYEAARIAMESLEHSDKGFVIFDELDIEIVIASLTPEVRRRYLARTIKEVSTKDKELLRVYYEEEMSLTETGKRLFLHKNTLQYRLDRIARQTGYNPRKFQDAVVLYLALQMPEGLK